MSEISEFGGGGWGELGERVGSLLSFLVVTSRSRKNYARLENMRKFEQFDNLYTL